MRKANHVSAEIVLHAVKGEILPDGAWYRYGELYRVNLDKAEISKCRGGKLYLNDCLSSMVISGHAIYVLGGGGVRHSKKGIDGLFTSEQHLHSRASFIDLDNTDGGWKPLPDFKSRIVRPVCVSFQGNLFVFGGMCKRGNGTPTVSPGEEINPRRNGNARWSFLPDPPEQAFNVSRPVLVDNKNNRILVHFKDSCSLYAYYPHQSKWEFLLHFAWHKTLALFGDMLFFHAGCTFHAFDLATKTQLHPIISTDFPPCLLWTKFDVLITLAQPGSFCLALDRGPILPDKTCLKFVKFCIERPCSGQPHIIFDSCCDLDVDGRASVASFVPIVTRSSPKKDTSAKASETGVLIPSDTIGI
ncbi:hypothetical protein RND81_02G131300 [Saponaria officinalis]|uniref:Uncharacterized protein n=1 Tax=Saponaria officinalis TaxID=3572 RepID=A0AAW1MLU8_SAPOF